MLLLFVLSTSSEAIISFAFFKIFLTLGPLLAPLPDPPPARELYAPSHKCLHIENYPATPLAPLVIPLPSTAPTMSPDSSDPPLSSLTSVTV